MKEEYVQMVKLIKNSYILIFTVNPQLVTDLERQRYHEVTEICIYYHCCQWHSKFWVMGLYPYGVTFYEQPLVSFFIQN